MGVIIKADSIDKVLKKRGLEPNGKVQRFLTNEIAKNANPYVPYKDGGLKDKQVRIEPNCIIYYAPYARKQYYENKGNGKQGTNKGGLRGKRWIERMMADHKNQIAKSVAIFAGGKAK